MRTRTLVITDAASDRCQRSPMGFPGLERIQPQTMQCSQVSRYQIPGLHQTAGVACNRFTLSPW
jgi:hypothetical protein